MPSPCACVRSCVEIEAEVPRGGGLTTDSPVVQQRLVQNDGALRGHLECLKLRPVHGSDESRNLLTRLR
jgi:hypothetical protein